MKAEDLTIEAGDTLVVRSFDDNTSYILQVNGVKKINKSRVSLKEIVGQPYGSCFELNNRKFTRISELDQEETERYADGADVLEFAVDSTEIPLSVPGVGNDVDSLSADISAKIAGNEGANSSINDAVVITSSSSSNIPLLRGDNSNYVDTNTAQKLTTNDITKMKICGTSAQEIIQNLITNSETFAVKTDFAQAKWIKKKENKYRRRYKISRPTPLTVCDASYCKNPDKICNLRPDSLAQILSHSGVAAGCRVLVLESTAGLIVGSLAYRMRGRGEILALYGVQQPHFEMANLFNLDESALNIVQPVPTVEVGPAVKHVCAHGFLYGSDIGNGNTDPPHDGNTTTSTTTTTKCTITTSTTSAGTGGSTTSKRKYQNGNEEDCSIQEEKSGGQPDTTSTSTSSACTTTGSNIVDGIKKLIDTNSCSEAFLTKEDLDDILTAPSNSYGNDSSNKVFQHTRKKVNKNLGDCVNGRNKTHATGRTKAEQEVLRRYLRQGSNRLIIASKFRPLPILKQALYLLRPSSPFVVYQEHIEPLVDCYMYLQQHNLAVRLVLSDTWCRQFQTLPGRVRPEMFMSTSGGFILTGIYVGTVPCSYPFTPTTATTSSHPITGATPIDDIVSAIN